MYASTSTAITVSIAQRPVLGEQRLRRLPALRRPRHNHRTDNHEPDCVGVGEKVARLARTQSW
jgi:hypothetical protein